MARKSAKTAATALPVPQSVEQANAQIERLGDLMRQRESLQTGLNDALARVREALAADISENAADIEAVKGGLAVWAAANRVALTENGRTKTAKMLAGEISWRRRPPKVGVRGPAVVIEQLKALGLTRFLRVKEDINRDAMLADPEVAAAIPGVTIGSTGEDLIIKPANVDLEEIVQ